MGNFMLIYVGDRHTDKQTDNTAIALSSAAWTTFGVCYNCYYTVYYTTLV